MDKKVQKTPFKDLSKTLKDLREKPLSDERVKNINSILENTIDKPEESKEDKKIASSSGQRESTL